MVTKIAQLIFLSYLPLATESGAGSAVMVVVNNLKDFAVVAKFAIFARLTRTAFRCQLALMAHSQQAVGSTHPLE